MRTLSTSSAFCGLICCTLAALSTTTAAQNPLGQKAARQFAGTFRGKDIALELRFDAAANGYRGTLTFQGKQMPCTGSEQGDSLAGSFTSEGANYAFTAKLAADRLSLTSDGQEYALQRQLAAGEDRPAVVPGNLPAWLVPGARATWWGGSASIPGVRSHLVQDDKGDWVDPNTGQKYSDQATQGGGGMGYTQFDIVSVSPTAIAVDSRNWLITDVQRGNCTLTTGSGFVGSGEALGDYWIHPAKLAQMQDANAGGTRIMRMPYPLNGHTYHAISITTDTASGFVRSVYDLETGLSLVNSSSTVGANVPVANPNGTATTGAGTTMITSTRFLGVRQLHLPWADGPMPDWLQRGGTFAWRGTYRTLIPGTPELAPWRLDASAAVARPQEGFATMKLSTRLNMNGMPQDNTLDRVAGTHMIGGLFVDPRSLRELEPNQTIDQDPITKVRTWFAGVQNGAGMVVEENALDVTRYVYDLKNGMLVGSERQTRNGVATTIISVRLVTGR